MILADDSGLFRDLLTHTLSGHGHQIVAEAATADDLVAAALAHDTDVVLTDIRMPPTWTDDGLQASLRIRAAKPGVGIVLLSHHGEADYAVRLLQDVSDRVAYLLKERATGARELLGALERVVAGDVVIDPSLVARLMNLQRSDHPLDQLTERETEVLALMAEGLSNAAIARRLHVTLSTVEKHATAVFRKLVIDAGDGGDNARVSAVLTYLRHRGHPGMP